MPGDARIILTAADPTSALTVIEARGESGEAIAVTIDPDAKVLDASSKLQANAVDPPLVIRESGQGRVLHVDDGREIRLRVGIRIAQIHESVGIYAGTQIGSA